MCLALWDMIHEKLSRISDDKRGIDDTIKDPCIVLGPGSSYFILFTISIKMDSDQNLCESSMNITSCFSMVYREIGE